MASAKGSSLEEAPAAEHHLSFILTSSVENRETCAEDEEAVTTVYFLVGDRQEAALVPKNAPLDDIKGKFRLIYFLLLAIMCKLSKIKVLTNHLR
jgi:hypothetical protein